MHTAIDSTEILSTMIVTDDTKTRELLWDVLGFLGHKITYATCGEVALEKLVAARYEVLFLDMELPDMSGWDLLREIRSRDSSLCIILLTSEENDISPIDAMQAGADGCYSGLWSSGEDITAEDLGTDMSPDSLDVILWRSVERRHLAATNARLQKELSAQRDQASEARQRLETVQKQVLQAQRDMAVLEMANVASYELIQPLKVLIGRIDMLIQESVLDGKLIDELLRLRRQAMVISPIVRRMSQITDGQATPAMGMNVSMGMGLGMSVMQRERFWS